MCYSEVMSKLEQIERQTAELVWLRSLFARAGERLSYGPQAAVNTM